ncbi:MAG: thiol-disulfide oxidoreductase DCC family protein, partial [Sphingobacteriales bacterium]
LFDGVCNLCNSLVNWIIDHDNNNQFMFATLQSAYGKEIVKDYTLKGNYLDTVILLDENKVFLRSAAVLKIFRALGYPYKLVYGTVIVPSFLRDVVYNFIAANRYKWFGKRDICRVPTPELKAKFLE